MSYLAWIDRYDRLSAKHLMAMSRDINSLQRTPLVSIIVLPSGHADEKTVESLRHQIYRKVEVLLVASGGVDESKSMPERFRLVSVSPTASEAEMFNAALAELRGEFCMALEAGDALSLDALYQLVRALNANPGADLLYGDEDDFGEVGLRVSPFFKPKWSPLLALSFDYVGRTGLFRTERLRRLNGAQVDAGAAWRWDILLRLTSADAPASASVAHVPHVILHRHRGSAAPRLPELHDGKAVVERTLAARGRACSVTVDERGWLVVSPRMPAASPEVAIIIPTRDGHAMLRRCVESILSRTTYRRFTISIVDNDSVEAETFRYFDVARKDPRVRVIRHPGAFNYAALHNSVVPQTTGEILALVNNDIEVVNPEWLETMLSFALQPETGVVGAKLYFPDDTIQHAGVVLGEGSSPRHVFRRRDRREAGPRGLLQISRDMSAVTGACMVMRRSVFEEVGGLDEAYRRDFNDIDLCLRVREHGYRVVWAANAELYHLESATRGTPKGTLAQLIASYELQTFCARWGQTEDPFFSPNVTGDDVPPELAFPPRVPRFGQT